MVLTVSSYSGQEWIKVLEGGDKADMLLSELYNWINLIRYVDDFCVGGWEGYVKRVKNYKESVDYLKELFLDDGLGRDKVWEFVSSVKCSFVNWLRDNKKGNTFGLVKRDDGSEEYQDCWFMKWDDTFMCYSCEYIGDITIKLLGWVKVV